MTSAPEISVDGVRLDAQSLEQVVREAIAGQLVIEDLEGAMDPKVWLGRVAQAVIGTRLEAPLRQVIARLFASPSLAEVAAALHLHRTVPIDGATLWDLFFTQMAHHNEVAGVGVLQALVLVSGRGALAYDPRLRSIDLGAASARLRAVALTLLGKYDAAWLVDHAELFGHGDDAQIEAIGHAAMAMGSADLSALRDGLTVKLGALPAALPIDAMIEARRKAGL